MGGTEKRPEIVHVATIQEVISNEPQNRSHVQKRKEFRNENWGKRRKMDTNKVQELAATLKPKAKRFTWAQISIALFYFCLFFENVLSFDNHGLIAFDCGSPDINLTTYSLMDVASCVPPSDNLTTLELDIQVLQRNVKSETKIYQCEVIMKRRIRHCGMHSHTSEYERGYAYIIKEYTAEEYDLPINWER